VSLFRLRGVAEAAGSGHRFTAGGSGSVTTGIMTSNPDAVSRLEGLRVRGASREVDTPPVISDKAAGSRQV
jgi:hypothetical protein